MKSRKVDWEESESEFLRILMESEVEGNEN